MLILDMVMLACADSIQEHVKPEGPDNSIDLTKKSPGADLEQMFEALQ